MQANDVTIWIWHFRWRRLSLNLKQVASENVCNFTSTSSTPLIRTTMKYDFHVYYIFVFENLRVLDYNLISWDQNQGYVCIKKLYDIQIMSAIQFFVKVDGRRGWLHTTWGVDSIPPENEFRGSNVTYVSNTIKNTVNCCTNVLQLL